MQLSLRAFGKVTHEPLHASNRLFALGYHMGNLVHDDKVAVVGSLNRHRLAVDRFDPDDFLLA